MEPTEEKKVNSDKKPNIGKQSSLQLDRVNYETNNVCPVDHLRDMFNETHTFKEIENPMLRGKGKGYLPESSFIEEGCFCIEDRQFQNEEDLKKSRRFMKGGPRKYLYWKPDDVKAAIVTCGGLCPGLNVVIRELVMSLWYNYGVTDIYGIKFGYKGFTVDQCWERLTPDKVKNIHNMGGSILAMARGFLDNTNKKDVANTIVENIHQRGANMIFCIGGDGTHKGMNALVKSCKDHNYCISFIGIPKTIDNDIAIIDKSFGFDSAVEIAQMAIQAADVEANSAEYGVGLVKVMGRNAGHIAMNASLASRDVNLCLVPEFKFDLYGPNGVLEYVIQRLQRKNHCVIVVGEGAGNACRDGGKVLQERGHKVVQDKSGNIYPPDIGSLLKDEIIKYAKEKHGMDVTLKYIDPTYMVRAVPAIPSDKHLCSVLAQNAVHGAMAGFTNFTCGVVRGVSAYLPINVIAEQKEAVIQKGDRNWIRLVASTGQTTLLNSDGEQSEII